MRSKNESAKRIRHVLIVLAVNIVIGTIGFKIIGGEDTNMLDAL